MSEINNSLQQRHFRFATPKEVVFSLVAKATKETPLRREKIIKGYDSEVYFVKTAEGNTYVVKIRWYGSVTYHEEAWAMNLCRKAGVPVSKILLLDEIELADGKHEVMVQQKLEGQALADIRGQLDSAQLEKILTEAGAILSRIHSIKVGGFYRRHQSGRWDFPNWEKFADSMVKARTREKPFILQAGITEKEFALLIGVLKEYKDSSGCEQPVLCHGDFLPEHIFVDDDLHISGILDFGMYEGNHPVHDFAFIDLEAPNIDLEAIKSGYTNKTIFTDDFQRRLLLHKISLAMGHLAHHIKEGMQVEAKFNYQRLKESLKELN